MKQPRIRGGGFRIKIWGPMAMLLGVVGLCGPVIAATETVAGVTVVRPDTVAPGAAPEPAPGGAVVLRGIPPVAPNAGRPAARGGPTGNGAAALVPPEGWDRVYDAAGITRRGDDAAGIERRGDVRFDAAGLDRRFDRSGLSRP